MRHPKFIGLREDKTAREVRLESPEGQPTMITGLDIYCPQGFRGYP
jgi:hypothetical protein